MAWIRTEEEVDKMIEQMKAKNKGRYITQGVTLGKDNELHMYWLKMSLMNYGSFSGLIKELLAEKFNGKPDEKSKKSKNDEIVDNGNVDEEINDEPIKEFKDDLKKPKQNKEDELDINGFF